MVVVRYVNVGTRYCEKIYGVNNGICINNIQKCFGYLPIDVDIDVRNVGFLYKLSTCKNTLSYAERLSLLCRPKPIHCNYQLAHYSGFCRISPSILNRFKPNLQA